VDPWEEERFFVILRLVVGEASFKFPSQTGN